MKNIDNAPIITDEEKEIINVYDIFWQSLACRDSEKRFSVCSDDICAFGTGLYERIEGLKEIRKMNEIGLAQLPDPFEIKTLWQTVRPNKEVAWVQSETLWITKLNDKVTKSVVRLTTIFEKKDGKWLVVHFHGSEPDYRIKRGEYTINEDYLNRDPELERKVYNRTEELEEEKLIIEKQIVELEQQALQTMMNPHFIFNVINSIQHFINANEKEAANRYLTDFAKLIRMNLNISYKRYIPLTEEIDYLHLYLSFEKLRFGDKLTYEINVATEIDAYETTIAVMMIQPFIENAIIHGIMPLNENGHINVQINKEDDNLIKIIISDNGVGIGEKFLYNDFHSQIKESHALSMTLQRLNLIGKSTNQQLYIRYRHAHPAAQRKGTIAEMILPAEF